MLHQRLSGQRLELLWDSGPKTCTAARGGNDDKNAQRSSKFEVQIRNDEILNSSFELRTSSFICLRGGGLHRHDVLLFVLQDVADFLDVLVRQLLDLVEGALFIVF